MFRRVACRTTDDAASQRAAAILHWLVSPGGPRVTKFKAWEFLQRRHSSRFRRVEDVAPALDLLVRHHYLRAVHPGPTRGRPGRPPEVTYEVNPAVYRDPTCLRLEELDRGGA
jgi:hypothetical protein